MATRVAWSSASDPVSGHTSRNRLPPSLSPMMVTSKPMTVANRAVETSVMTCGSCGWRQARSLSPGLSSWSRGMMRSSRNGNSRVWSFRARRTSASTPAGPMTSASRSRPAACAGRRPGPRSSGPRCSHLDHHAGPPPRIQPIPQQPLEVARTIHTRSPSRISSRRRAICDGAPSQELALTGAGRRPQSIRARGSWRRPTKERWKEAFIVLRPMGGAATAENEYLRVTVTPRAARLRLDCR